MIRKCLKFKQLIDNDFKMIKTVSY